MTLEDACRRALRDLPPPPPDIESVVVLLALGAGGRAVCLASGPRAWGCACLAEGMDRPEALLPEVV